MPGLSGVGKPVIQHQFGHPELHQLDQQPDCPAARHKYVQIRRHIEKNFLVRIASSLVALSYRCLWGQWGSGELFSESA